MKKKMKLIGIICLLTIIVISIISCNKAASLNGNSTGNNKTRNLADAEYVIISPQDYAKKIKAGEIGINEKYVIDGLVMGTSENNIMIQKAGLTNIFTHDEPVEFNMGTKIRVYIETTMINTMLISASQATIKKLERL